MSEEYDLVVIGATPGGLAAALAAARLGGRVALVEEQAHIGGMAASGLGKSDVEQRDMIGGIFKEFVERIHAHYLRIYGPRSQQVALCRDGYYYEPHVAERVFESMVAAEPGIELLKGWRLSAAHKRAETLVAVTTVSTASPGRSQQLRAAVFIDATYEGDLYAAAGAAYRLGREARHEFDEPHAGVVYYDYQNHAFLDGSTGQADTRLPAYTYRLCLTTCPSNAHILRAPPPDYDRGRYLGYFDDLAAGRLAGPKVLKPGRGYYPPHFDTMMRAFSMAELPNSKFDVNINPRPLGFPFPEENQGYVEGDAHARARIREKHRNLTLGLLWFLQHDPQIPAAHRVEANRFHLPQDEFTDNGHFPFQLYVREARRLIGGYTLTERDIMRQDQAAPARSHDDTIAVGEFPIDSFPCRKRRNSDTLVLEGYLGMLDAFTRPYEIPYRVMLPEVVDGLLAPVAASTTHVAYSSIRMEPTWMALGQAAGVAAHLAIAQGVAPRDVAVPRLREILQAQGQVLQHRFATAV